MRLTLQLEASRSRNSHLNARIFSTLDTLDYLQLELDLERKRSHAYSSAQAAWKEKLRELEGERDDMKQAVEMLIKQGTHFVAISIFLRRMNQYPFSRTFKW